MRPRSAPSPGSARRRGGDLGRHRDRPGLDRPGLREPFGERSPLQSGPGQEVGDRPGGDDEPREQVLGADGLAPVECPRLHRRVAQDGAEGERSGRGPGFGSRGLLPGGRGQAERVSDLEKVESELGQQLGGAALRLVGQGGEQVGRLDDRRPSSQRADPGAFECPERARGE